MPLVSILISGPISYLKNRIDFERLHEIELTKEQSKRLKLMMNAADGQMNDFHRFKGLKIQRNSCSLSASSFSISKRIRLLFSGRENINQSVQPPSIDLN